MDVGEWVEVEPFNALFGAGNGGTQRSGDAALQPANHLRGFDFDGQEALKDSRVLVVASVDSAAQPRSIWQAPVSATDAARLRHGFALESATPDAARDATVGQPKVESARDALARITHISRLRQSMHCWMTQNLQHDC